MKYQEMKQTAARGWENFHRRDRFRILVGSGTCGRAAGSGEVLGAFKEELRRYFPQSYVPMSEVGCLGLCFAEPLVEIRGTDGRRVLYRNLTAEMVPELVQSHLVNGAPFTPHILALMEGPPIDHIPRFEDLPSIKPQVRIALRNCGHIDPTDIRHYIARGGYAPLAAALSRRPEEIIETIEASQLRDRGAYGVSTGLKWRLCRNAPADARCIICSGGEGDPGAFMARSLLEGDPHAVIEGMLIGAWAIGADSGMVVVPDEYPLAAERMRNALKEAAKLGLLGENILDTGFGFLLSLVPSPENFGTGEESALIALIEGKAAEPRPEPLLPTPHGLNGKPTCINAVETWACVPPIIEKGAAWFSGIGVGKNGGTGVFSLSGKVNNTGLFEVPMGTPLQKVIFEIGGGIPEDKPFKAVHTGGPAGACLPESMMDIPMTYEAFASAGSLMGPGGMVVLDGETCMVDLARFYLRFTSRVSCGKCLPSREGIRCMLEILDRICAGTGEKEDLSLLENLALGVSAASLCRFGRNAPNPVLSTLRHFRDEYEAHIFDKKCPAGFCRALVPAPSIPPLSEWRRINDRA